jgi:hypothetical protein
MPARIVLTLWRVNVHRIDWALRSPFARSTARPVLCLALSQLGWNFGIASSLALGTNVSTSHCSSGLTGTQLPNGSCVWDRRLGFRDVVCRSLPRLSYPRSSRPCAPDATPSAQFPCAAYSHRESRRPRSLACPRYAHHAPRAAAARCPLPCCAAVSPCSLPNLSSGKISTSVPRRPGGARGRKPHLIQKPMTAGGPSVS